MNTRTFDLGDILSIADRRLVSPRGMAGIYDILNFMTGDNLFTHQVPRAIRECQPELLRQHPQLAAIDKGRKLTAETVPGWLATQKRLFGNELPVAPLAQQVWTRIDPLLEAEAMVGKDRVVAISADAQRETER
jgi:hypothetical protein